MNLTNKISRYLAVFGFIVLCILLFTLYRGCQNNKMQLATTKVLQDKISADSIKMLQDSLDFVSRIQFATGKMELNYEQYLSAKDSIDNLNESIVSLKRRYKPVIPATDTTATTVPNDYIYDCSDCFSTLDKGQKLVAYLQKKTDSLLNSYNNSKKILTQRVDQLNTEKANLQATLRDCLSIAKQQQKQYTPTRKMKLALSIITINNAVPKGVGGGFFYEDKKERDYGMQVFGTNVGTIYTGTFLLPLSFKRKK